ncbi:MAG TPA: hypothetical protein VL443_23910 [Cyclobacteriaceae bacterium]|nr:hypothetical protein [Cyclobacteriaceae bacterium]
MSLLIVFLLFIFFYFLFIWKAEKSFPIIYLFLFVYFVQYIFSVYLIYNVYPALQKQMPINQSEYFTFCIPALLFLFAGVLLFNRNIPVIHLFKNIDTRSATNLGHLLLGISYFFEALSYFGLPGINSILSFTHFLRYAGGMCYLFVPSVFNYFLLALVYLGLAKDALTAGVFIDFFIWCTYLFLMTSLRFNFSLKLRSAFIFIAIPLLVIIQSVKEDYRAATWSGKSESGFGLITELASEKNEEDDSPFGKSEGVINTVGRLNQGWHLGMVLRWVPRKQSFSDGDDMLGDIEGAVLPRIFFPEKKIIGSQDKFQKYTGHKLGKGVSMTIGVLGDFYINFGRWGSFIMLFVFGALISRMLYLFVRKYVVTDPINIVWIPFLFSYLVRANNDFYIVINNLVKGYLIFLFVTYLRKRIWPIRPIQKLR